MIVLATRAGYLEQTDGHTSEVMSGGCGFVYLRLLLFSIVYVYVNVLMMMIMMTFHLSVGIKQGQMKLK